MSTVLEGSGSSFTRTHPPKKNKKPHGCRTYTTGFFQLGKNTQLHPAYPNWLLDPAGPRGFALGTDFPWLCHLNKCRVVTVVTGHFITDQGVFSRRPTPQWDMEFREDIEKTKKYPKNPNVSKHQCSLYLKFTFFWLAKIEWMYWFHTFVYDD